MLPSKTPLWLASDVCVKRKVTIVSVSDSATISIVPSVSNAPVKEDEMDWEAASVITPVSLSTRLFVIDSGKKAGPGFRLKPSSTSSF